MCVNCCACWMACYSPYHTFDPALVCQAQQSVATVQRRSGWCLATGKSAEVSLTVVRKCIGRNEHYPLVRWASVRFSVAAGGGLSNLSKRYRSVPSPKEANGNVLREMTMGDNMARFLGLPCFVADDAMFSPCPSCPTLLPVPRVLCAWTETGRGPMRDW